MPAPNLGQETNSPAANGGEAGASSNASKAAPAKTTLPGEIKKGWDWVVFSWQMLQRMGGPREILQSLLTLISLLAKRTLVQWGLLKGK